MANPTSISLCIFGFLDRQEPQRFLLDRRVVIPNDSEARHLRANLNSDRAGHLLGKESSGDHGLGMLYTNLAVGYI